MIIPNDDTLFTMEEVSRYLRISHAEVYSIVRIGLLKSIQISGQCGHHRIAGKDVHRFRKACAWLKVRK
jgi:hypothetical protein